MSRKRFSIIATAFDRKGKVICSASNSYDDSCALMRYYAIKTANYLKVFNHAEIACISKAMKLKKTIARLVIIRCDSGGNLRNAKPCVICSSAISDFKIKNISYSTEEGMVHVSKI